MRHGASQCGKFKVFTTFFRVKEMNETILTITYGSYATYHMDYMMLRVEDHSMNLIRQNLR